MTKSKEVSINEGFAILYSELLKESMKYSNQLIEKLTLLPDFSDD